MLDRLVWNVVYNGRRKSNRRERSLAWNRQSEGRTEVCGNYFHLRKRHFHIFATGYGKSLIYALLPSASKVTSNFFSTSLFKIIRLLQEELCNFFLLFSASPEDKSPLHKQQLAISTQCHLIRTVWQIFNRKFLLQGPHFSQNSCHKVTPSVDQTLFLRSIWYGKGSGYLRLGRGGGWSIIYHVWNDWSKQ